MLFLFLPDNNVIFYLTHTGVVYNSEAKMSMRIQVMFLLLAVSISQAHFCEEIVVVKEGIRQAVYNADGKKITSSFGEPAINSKKAQLSRTCDEQDYKFHKQKQHYNWKIR
jgi:hypothetical protein